MTVEAAPDRVILDGAPLTRSMVDGVCAILADEHDKLMRCGDYTAARKIRALWLDIDLARPVSWVEDNRPIATVEPINITVRALNPRLWLAVPDRSEDAA